MLVIIFGANSPQMRELRGHVAIGHNRYSTSGNVNPFMEIQPFSSELAFGGFALAHNGNLTNAGRLRASLIETGSLFQSSSDTEVIVHLVARSHQADVTGRLTDALKQIDGAYSLVCVADDMLIGVRDPHGVRPLVLGKRDDTWILASESCALDIVGAAYVRDLEPGEMLVIRQERRDEPETVPDGVVPVLRLRIYLFRPSRLGYRRPRRLSCPQGDCRTGQRVRCRGGYRHSSSRSWRSGCPWFCRGVRRAV